MSPTSVTPPRPGHRELLTELRQKAAIRLAERVDFARSKHKPVSLLRAEAKRTLEQFLDVEVPHWSRSDKDQFIEELIADAMGLGAIEELFRDESIQEFLILAHNQIIVRKAGSWQPSNIQLRDPEQYKQILSKLAVQGEQIVAGEQPQAALDVRLKNGYRVTAIRPPDVLDLQPVATFHRVKSSVVPTGPAATTNQPTPVLPPPTPRAPDKAEDTDSTSVSFAATLRPGAGGSMGGAMSNVMTARVVDPAERVKIRVTERIVRKLAAAGVYDLNSLPKPEFSRIVGLHVAEVCTAERIAFDEAAQERLTAEILAGMTR
jgi:hypothetical protein